MTPTGPVTETRTARALVVVGIVLLSLNLRPAAVSVGPVLAEITESLRLTGVEAGLLTSLPVIAFAGFGALTPRLSQLIGPHRLTLFAVLAATVGLFGRSLVGNTWLFLALSLLALSGMAAANVLLPSLVKRHFPDRVGLMTAVYSTTMAIGLTTASVLTVPIADGYGGWRTGLASWGLFAVVAVLPWIGLAAHDRPDGEAKPATISMAAVARTRLGWLMALFFGLQSLQAYAVFGWFPNLYRSAGFSPTDAGIMLGVATGISIPLSFVVPALTARPRAQLPVLFTLGGCYLVGYLGLLLAPARAGLLWALLVGIGTSTFPMVLALIGLRSRTAAGTAALSGFTQSVGYVIAAPGPLLIGLLHDVTGAWTVPLLTLMAIAVALVWVGTTISRPDYIEDHLPGHLTRSASSRDGRRMVDDQ
ncbi:MFS transporter [Micropruina sp.]|uniref:CynX/NimT family MFS transporter n=1 Tax=Micropruina sp. TaxID=2737536 RepID=UPI002614263F|nr:MFS transporter [Micropruina sp.]